MKGFLVLVVVNLLIVHTSSNVATITSVVKGPNGRVIRRGPIRVANVRQDFANNFNINEINSLDPRYVAINATFATGDEDIVYLVASTPQEQDLLKLTYDPAIQQYRATVEAQLYDYRSAQAQLNPFGASTPRTVQQFDAIYKAGFQYVGVVTSRTFTGNFLHDGSTDPVFGPRGGAPRNIQTSRLSVQTWTEGFYGFNNNDRRLGNDNTPLISLNGTAWDRSSATLFVAGGTPVDTRLIVLDLTNFGALGTIRERILFRYDYLASPDSFVELTQDRTPLAITVQTVQAIEYSPTRGVVGVVKTISGTVQRTISAFGNRGPLQTDFSGRLGSYAVYELDRNAGPLKLFDLPTNIESVNSTTLRENILYISWYQTGGSGYVSAYSLTSNTLVGSSRIISQTYSAATNAAQTLNFLNNIDDCHFTQVVQPLTTCLDGHLDALEVCEASNVRLCANIHEDFVGGFATCAYDCLAWDTTKCKRVQPFDGGKWRRGLYGYCPRGWGVTNALGEDFWCEGSRDIENKACILPHKQGYKRCNAMEECDTVEMIDPIHPIHSKCGNLRPCVWLRKLPFKPHQQWRSCVKPARVCPWRTTWDTDNHQVNSQAPLVPDDHGLAVRSTIWQRCKHRWGTVQLDGPNTCACVPKARVARKPLTVRRVQG